MRIASIFTQRLLTAIALLAVTAMSAQTSGQIANYGSSGSAGAAANTQIGALLGPGTSKDMLRKMELNEIQGSPYESMEFKPGRVYYENDALADIFYRLNAYNEQIEVKQINSEDAPISSLGTDKKIRLVSAGRSTSFQTFIDKKGNTLNGYLTTLVDGDYRLYKRIHVKYTEGQKAQNSFVKAIPAKFSQFEEYYIQVPGIDRIDFVQLKRKKVLKALPEELRAKGETILQERAMDIRTEIELIRFFQALNQVK